MADVVFREVSPWAEPWRHRGAVEGEAALDIAEAPRSASALLTARRGRTHELARAAHELGLDLPQQPSWTQGRGFAVLWAGPGQWLVRGPRRFADLAGRLEPLAPFGTLIDQSHARAVLTLAGQGARDVLARGFEIDLHPRVFKPGDLATTMAAGIPATIWQVDERPTYEIAVPRSMAGSFWHWLAAAAAPYGARVEGR